MASACRPIPFDFDGDHKGDLWYVDDAGWHDAETSTMVPRLADPATETGEPAAGDYDGDGTWEPAEVIIDATTFEPTGEWRTAGSAGSLWLAPPTCVEPVGVTTPQPMLVPLIGDWDGDRTTDPGWFCAATATWVLEGRAPFVFGRPWDGPRRILDVDLPAPADHDGDGRTDAVLYRPADGTWWAEGGTAPLLQTDSWGVPAPANLTSAPGDELVLHSGMTGAWDVDGVAVVPDPARPQRWPAAVDLTGDHLAEQVEMSLDGSTHRFWRPDGSTVAFTPTGNPFPAATAPSTASHVILTAFIEHLCTLGSISFDSPCPRMAVPGDMDGDGIADLAWREEVGIAWGIAGDPTQHGSPDPGCQPDAYTEACIQNVSVPGDWDGDGDWDHGVYLGSTGTWVGEGVSVALPMPDCPDLDPSVSVFAPVLPVPGQWDDDWATDPAWYCSTDGTWHFEGGTTLTLGIPAPHSPAWLPVGDSSDGAWFDIPVPGFDVDGDGIDDPAVYRPTDGTLRTIDGPVVTGLGLGLPINGSSAEGGDDIAVFQLSADASMGGAPPLPDPHRWRRADGSTVEIPLDPQRPYLMPARLDADGDGDDELGGIARDDLGGGVTEHYLVEGQPPFEFFDEWAYLPMTMPVPTLYRIIAMDAMLRTCRTTAACPATLWP